MARISAAKAETEPNASVGTAPDLRGTYLWDRKEALAYIGHETAAHTLG